MAAKEAPARVTSKGRVCIPNHIREELSLSYGDYVMLSVEPLDGGTTE